MTGWKGTWSRSLSRAISLILLVGAFSGARATAETPDLVLKAFLDAYNRHDVSAVLSFVSDDIGWYSVEGDTIRTEAKGKQALRDSLTAYFKALPSARSQHGQPQQSGPYISVKETAFWTVAGEEKSQSALAVYFFEGGRIKSVWYFPAT